METLSATPTPEGPKRTFGQRFLGFFEDIPKYVAALFSAITGMINPALAWIAGCDLGIVKTMPSGELNKKAAIGLAMIFTITVAAFAAGNAASIFLSPSMRVPFAVLWALMIFGIDRAIIVFIDMQKANGNGGKGFGKFLAISARIIIVFFMSYITSASVEMLVFEKEINGVITEKRYDEIKKINAQADSAEAVIDSARIEATMQVSAVRLNVERYAAKLDSEIDTLQKEIKARRDLLQEEVAGRVGSRLQGMGPTAKAIMLNITADSTRLAELETKRDSAIANSTATGELVAAEEFAAKTIARLDKRSALLAAEKRAKLAQVSQVVGDGFLDRYLALGGLWGKTAFLMIVFFVILMLVECLPILLKLFSGNGLYEEALAKQLQTHRVQVFNKLELDLAKEQGEHLGKLIAANQTSQEHELALLTSQEIHLTDLAEKHKDLEAAQRVILEAKNTTARKRTEVELKGLADKAKRISTFINEAKKQFARAADEDGAVRTAKNSILRRLIEQAQRVLS